MTTQALPLRRRRGIDWGDLWRGLRRAPLVPTAILALIIGAAVFAPWLAPADPNAFQLTDKLIPPAWQEGGSTAHLLGTDQLGRDVLSRIIYGARIACVVVAITIVAAGLLGITLGLLAGYLGGWVDALVMRIVDIQLSIPAILLAIAIAGATVNTNVGGFKVAGVPANVLVILVIFNWAPYARVVRGETLSLKQRDYVALARVAGVRPLTIMRRHILPNVFNSVVVISTLDIAGVILFEATLSFLGFGVTQPTATWGSMLSDGRKFIVDAWWLAAFPGLAITFTTLAANLLGDWVRDALDPRLRQI
jgi:peptide/nickel transport system permease protein